MLPNALKFAQRNDQVVAFGGPKSFIQGMTANQEYPPKFVRETLNIDREALKFQITLKISDKALKSADDPLNLAQFPMKVESESLKVELPLKNFQKR